ncbi:YncE family protein [Blastomonas sp.]|uniref:YncE family protein n=1 Tax=Blastomonas sp. TaxID=1909299 RepID=UPI0035942AA0
MAVRYGLLVARQALMPLLLFTALPAEAQTPAATPAATHAASGPAAPISTSHGTLIIGNKGENTVSFIDLATGREMERRETGLMPHEVAISPDGNRAAVVAYGGQTIDIFDVSSGHFVETIDLAPNLRPHGIAWLVDGRIFATTEGSDTLTIVSPEGAGWKVSGIPTGNKGSHMLAVTADGARAFVSNLSSKNVTVLDVAKGKKVTDLAAGTEPEGIALTPDERELWVAARGSNDVYVFDAMSLKQLALIETGRFPIRIAISPDGKTAVTSDLQDGSLTLIDTATRTVKAKITLGGSERSAQVTLLFSPDGARLYAAETGLDRIAEIDMTSGTLIGRLPAGKNGDGLGLSPVPFKRN